MIRKIMKPAFLFMSLVIFSSYLRAADKSADVEGLEKDFASHLTVADGVLIEGEFVDYFKKMANSDHHIMISVKAQDTYGKREEYEDQKEFPIFSENEITQPFLLENFEGLPIFLSTAFRKYPSDVYEIRASIWVEAPGHREKVNGFCVIRPSGK